MEKYKLSGMGPAALGPAARDALHFKPMALDRDFKRLRATALPFVHCSVRLQMSLVCLKRHAVVAGDAGAGETLPAALLSVVHVIHTLAARRTASYLLIHIFESCEARHCDLSM